MKYSRYTLILLLILSALAIGTRYENLMRSEKEKTASLATIYANRFADELNTIISETDIIEEVLLLSKATPDKEQFEKLAQLIYNPLDYIAVSFLPQGVVEYAYPPELNKASLGHNVLVDDITKLEAIKAKQSGETVFSGPYVLKQGMLAIIARNPVYYTVNNEQVFWGFVAVAIDPSTLIAKTGIGDLLDFSYEINIESTYMNEKNEFYKSENFAIDQAFASHDIRIGQGEWRFTVYNRDAFFYEIIQLVILALACISLSLLLYLFVRKIEKRKQNSFEKSCIDTLTSLNNIKALHYYAKQREDWSKNGFTLFYLDLDKFKNINKKYSFEIGNKLLISFAKRLQEQFTEDTFLARIKDDEFIVLIPKSLEEYACLQIQNLILNMAEETYFIDTNHINISVSIGFASYPRDGNSFNEVMSKADENMYHYKEISF